jgi:hypothetical protein
MIELIVKPLNINELKLVRYDFNITQKELNEKLFDSMTREEQVWAQKLTLTIPNMSSDLDSEDVWDIILVDNYLFDCIEYILNKYKISYNLVDITENYFDRDILIDEIMKEDIEEYINHYLTLDMVLDKINEIGIKNINRFEKLFLEKYNSK